jgi:[ribosomal protein S18]-alanine N-acetyltransferase
MLNFKMLDENYFEAVIELTVDLKSDQFNWDRAKLLDSFRHGQLYGALGEKNNLDAFVLLRKINNETFEIECLATRSDKQNKGIMDFLLRRIIDNLNGAARELWLEVHEQNTKALALYRKIGFIQTGIRKNYYLDGSAAILCTKTI